MAKITDDFDIIHDIFPGRHYYQFYKSADDLMKVLLPYWAAGVRRNNYCFWVIPSFMTFDQARDALVKEIPQIDILIKREKFELMSHHDWYGDGETFDGPQVTKKYTDKIIDVIDRGFSVVRVAGDASGFKPHLWPQLVEYERQGHAQVDTMPCIALCCYPLHDLKLQQTKDVLDNHHGVLMAKV